jgi:hypothetical protein
MDLEVDIRLPVKATVSSLGPSYGPVLGMAVEGDSPPVGPSTRPSGTRQHSYWAECNCPGDCLRDHENE